jgi:hypothetical protein
MRPIRRIRSAILLIASLGIIAGSAPAEKVTLEKSVPVSGKKGDKTKFAGRVVAYDEEGFELKGKAAEPQKIPWDDLDAKTQFAVRKQLIDAKDPAAHVELGRALLGVEGAKELSEKAFAVALKLDPSLKDTIDEIKKDAASSPRKTKTTKKDDLARPPGEKPDMQETPNAIGPETVGKIQERFWGPQSEEQQAAAIAELKAFAQETQKKMEKPLELNETSFFLFYSDLDKHEARNWSSNLDDMYAELAKLFQIDRKTNIWRGKALVFVFRSATDYRRFQVTMHQTDPGPSMGMCHTYGNGLVHVAFYRPKDDLQFAHVLFHESVHGFLHRYRSPVNVPSWANEGLAEWIARKLLREMRVPDERLAREVQRREKDARYQAQLWIQHMGGIGDFFTADHIDGWQYNISEMMTTFMIAQSQKNYVAFINGIKDGLTWEQALETKYKATPPVIIPAFGRWLGVKIGQ